MSGERMIELVPGLWVRPEEVQGIWTEGDQTLRVQFKGTEPRIFHNHKNTPIEELAAKLDPPRWEQPPSDDDGLIEVRNMHGVVMYADSGKKRASDNWPGEFGKPPDTAIYADTSGYEDPPPEQVGAKGPTGAKGPPGVVLYADTTAPRGGLRWHDLKREE